MHLVVAVVVACNRASYRAFPRRRGQSDLVASPVLVMADLVTYLWNSAMNYWLVASVENLPSGPKRVDYYFSDQDS